MRPMWQKITMKSEASRKTPWTLSRLSILTKKMTKETRMMLLRKSVKLQKILMEVQQRMKRSEALVEELRGLSTHDKWQGHRYHQLRILKICSSPPRAENQESALGYRTSLAVALSIVVWIWATLKVKWSLRSKRKTTFLWKDQTLKVQLREQSVQRNLSNYKRYNQLAQSKQKRRKLYSLQKMMTSNLASNYKISLLGFPWYQDVQMLIRKDNT